MLDTGGIGLYDLGIPLCKEDHVQVNERRIYEVLIGNRQWGYLFQSGII